MMESYHVLLRRDHGVVHTYVNNMFLFPYQYKYKEFVQSSETRKVTY